MGSPLSPILADIVLEDIIEIALAELPFDIPFLRKYVDDLLLVIPKDQTETVLEVFNRQKQRLQFTIQTEQKGKLPFLDMTIIRNDNQSLTSEWYCKPIASGRMLNFYSFHQYKHKINVANNFIHRVNSLTTHDNIDTNSIIRQHLTSNCYPSTLVSRLINQYDKKHFVPQSTRIIHTSDPTTYTPALTVSSTPVAQSQPTNNSIATPQLQTNSEPTAATPDHHPNDTIYRSLLYIPKVTDRLIKTFRREFPNSTIATRLNSTPQITSKYGYETETYKLEAYDGFVIEMHRLKASPSTGPFDTRKRPVFLMHGLLGSSGDWILIGPKHALPYLLSDQGYDVWLGNARGNRYGREHSYLTMDMKEFWDFSWHEIGFYDVPMMVDFILKTRSIDKLHYIGHSQGTTAFFVMTSLLPDYNEKITKLYALAPAAYLNHLNQPLLKYLATHLEAATSVANMLGIHQISPSEPFYNQIANTLCPSNGMYCVDIISSTSEYWNLDSAILPVLIGHIPAGASIKQFFHFGQEVTSGHFRQFDYGPENNTQIYNSVEPPDYNLTNVRTPVSIYYALNDKLTHPEDVRRLAQELPNLVALYQLPNASFRHMDFLLAADIRQVLYERILASIEEEG
ncbi:lipase 3-like [Wyeomyia smithii]|uniref:lipase 3-like n=1 Tax=Wyeomyia smithii TaxID=174621 RepID=UPI00246805A6|nr:lipase 3-like [Wyeomyia smithii]